jgi:hypothetical protein
MSVTSVLTCAGGLPPQHLRFDLSSSDVGANPNGKLRADCLELLEDIGQRRTWIMKQVE